MSSRDEPSGWKKCPCDAPKKCSSRDKCESEYLMCRAFEEWATGGRCRAKVGEWLISIKTMFYPNKSKDSDTMLFKSKKGPRKNEIFIMQVLDLHYSGLFSYKEIGKMMGIGRNYASTIVHRNKGGKNERN